MSTCVIKFDPRTIFGEIYALDNDERGILFSLCNSVKRDFTLRELAGGDD